MAGCLRVPQRRFLSLKRIADLDSTSQAYIERIFQRVPFDQPKTCDRAFIAAVLKWKTLATIREQSLAQMEALFVAFAEDVSKKVAAAYENVPLVEVAENSARRNIEERLPAMMRAAYHIAQSRVLANLEQTRKAKDEFVDPDDITDLVKWNRDSIATRVRGISRYTQKRIAALIKAALEDGDSIAEVAARLRLMGFSSRRAERIARTEIISSSNAATFYGNGHSLGTVGLFKSWMATNDRRTRDTHVKASATQKNIPYNEPFKVGGHPMMFPGDSSLGAPAREIVQCRCTFTTFRSRRR